MGRRSKYSPELRERAVRMVFEHAPEYPTQWGAIRSVAEKIGCPVEVLRRVSPPGGAELRPPARADHRRASPPEAARKREFRAATCERDSQEGIGEFAQAELDRRAK